MSGELAIWPVGHLVIQAATSSLRETDQYIHLAQTLYHGHDTEQIQASLRTRHRIDPGTAEEVSHLAIWSSGHLICGREAERDEMNA